MAVQWLIDQIKQKLYIRESVIEKAKEMHEQQIKDAYGHGQNNAWLYYEGFGKLITKDDYYNETFKK